MFKNNKALKILGVILTLGVALTGCATNNTVEEAEHEAYSVIEIREGFLTESTFMYYDSEGVRKNLPNCERENISTKRVCTTQDGLVSFAYSTRKGRLRNGVMTVEGTAHSLKCTRAAANSEDIRSICIPVK